MAHSDSNAGTSRASGEAPSTGFLPLTLAVSLFVAGLFVLGFVPGLSCGPTEIPAAGGR